MAEEAPPPANQSSPDPLAGTQRVAMPEWSDMRDTLPTELRDSPSLESVDSFENLVQQHANVQHLIGGEKIPRPTDDSSDEDWSLFYNTMGRPEEASGYDLGDFNPPEGMPWDAQLQSGMVEDFHKAGLSNKQVNNVLRAFSARQEELWKQNQLAVQQSHEESSSGLRHEWGDSYDAKTEQAINGLRFAFGPELAAEIAQMPLPDGSLFGDNPVMIRAFQRIGSSMGEHAIVGPKSPGDPALTPAEAQREIEILEQDPEFLAMLSDHTRKRDPRVVRWNSLYQVAYPEGA